MNIEQLKAYFDEKFEEISSSNNVPQRQPEFKNKGNKSQYEHQEDVLTRIRNIERLVIRDKKEQALDELKEMENAVEKRIKLIRIADKSEHGWNTVNEYLSDEVAEDTDDEKRIRRAEACASRKRKSKQQVYLERKKRTQPNLERAGQDNSRFFRPQYKPKSFNPGDRCFQCGKQGHWKKFCPRGSSSARGDEAREARQ